MIPHFLFASLLKTFNLLIIYYLFWSKIWVMPINNIVRRSRCYINYQVIAFNTPLIMQWQNTQCIQHATDYAVAEYSVHVARY